VDVPPVGALYVANVPPEGALYPTKVPPEGALYVANVPPEGALYVADVPPDAAVPVPPLPDTLIKFLPNGTVKFPGELKLVVPVPLCLQVFSNPKLPPAPIPISIFFH
jgi:hypothetical protein